MNKKNRQKHRTNLEEKKRQKQAKELQKMQENEQAGKNAQRMAVYNEELSGNKVKFSYNVWSKTDVSGAQLLELCMRIKHPNEYNKTTRKYISKHFVNDYFENYGIHNFTGKDLFEVNPTQKDKQIFSFDYSDEFYSKLFMSKKVQIFPTEIEHVMKNDKEKEFQKSFYLSEVDGQVVLFLKIVSKSVDDKYIKDSLSGIQVFAYVQGKQEGCVCLMRYDHVDTSLHVQLLNDNKTELLRERFYFSGSHTHVPSQTFNRVFPAKINSCDAIEFKKEFDKFDDAVEFFDKKLMIDNNQQNLFNCREACENSDLEIAYKNLIIKCPSLKNEPKNNYKLIADYLKEDGDVKNNENFKKTQMIESEGERER